MFNLDPKQQHNGVEPDDENVSGSPKIEQRTDFTGLDNSKQQNQIGNSDEDSGRAAPTDQSLSKKNDLKKMLVLVGGLLATIFIVAGAFSLIKEKPKKQRQEVEQQTAEISNTNPHSFSETELPPPPVIEEEKPDDSSQGDTQNTSGNGQQTVVVQQQQPPEEPKPDPILERRLGGNVLVNDGGAVSSEQNNGTAQASYGGGVPKGFGNESNANERELNFTGTTFSARVAEKRGDRTLLLTRGTTIPCVLVTKIVTDHAGLTKCQATKDVWSANGKTVLIERGSVFLGEQTAAMLQGQARVAVRWTQMETPKGILVDIDSPSVGKLGAAGNAAWVNHHFWKRFGGSIMISLIGDFSNGLSKRISRKSGSNDFTLEETGSSMDEIAAEAIRNSINIPPTGTINQGALLNIMVARDIDFSKVYERIDVSDLQGALPTATATIQKPTLPTNMSVITE